MPTDDAEPDATTPPETRRWRLDLRYDGGAFHGWAAQPGVRTVQGELELWLARVLRLEEPVRLVCAGRTDAGVHARGQVAHVDLPVNASLDVDRLLGRLRRALPDDVAVTAIGPARAEFDARFGAIWRRYCYRIADAGSQPDPLWRHEVLTLDQPIDVAALQAAAQPLLGLRDFVALCRQRPGGTTIRTLLELSAVRAREGRYDSVIEVTVRADAFCHSMVRSLVGALTEVGRGRRPEQWPSELLRATSRASEVPVLPAHGLTLEEVRYPPDNELGQRARDARTRRELL